MLDEEERGTRRKERLGGRRDEEKAGARRKDGRGGRSDEEEGGRSDEESEKMKMKMKKWLEDASLTPAVLLPERS